MKSLLSSLVLILSMCMFTQAQQAGYSILDKSTMKIEGTSNIHDWTCDVAEINSDLSFNPTALTGGGGSFIETVSMTIPVKKIESGKSGMNKKIYDALKENDHPNISFKMTSSSLDGDLASGGSFSMTVSGNLTIAGKTRSVSIPVEGTKTGQQNFKFTGDHEIDMTDYNIEPPSALFGTVSAGKMVTVTFDVYVGVR